MSQIICHSAKCCYTERHFAHHSAESHSVEYHSAEYDSAKSTLFSNIQLNIILLLIDSVQLCVILTNAILPNAMAPNQALIFTYGVLIIICPKEFSRRKMISCVPIKLFTDAVS